MILIWTTPNDENREPSNCDDDEISDGHENI